MDEALDFIFNATKMGKGSEVFVPKLRAYNIVDVKNALTELLSDTDEKIVGIRTGEKLHEMLVTVDDARTTLELEDRYIIEPALAFWSNAHLTNDGAKRVPDGFEYTSNKNQDWLDDDGFRALISESGLG